MQDEEDSSSGQGSGKGSGRKFSFEDPIVNSSDKQQNGSSDNKKKKNRKKKKNKNNANSAAEVSASSGSENETTNNTSTKQSTATAATITNAKYLLDIESQLAKLNKLSCISNITIVLSGYNPPPSHRSILGDLAYLVVTLPDSQVVHVTAIPQGFYINKSTEKKFDPTPDINEGSSSKDSMACYSHSLLDTLLQKSKSLRTVYTTALLASKQRSELLSSTSFNESTLYNFFRPLVSPFSTNNLCGSSTSLVGGLLTGLVLSSSSTSGTFSSRIDMVTVKPSWLVPPLPSVHTTNNGNSSGNSSGSGGSNIMLGKKLETYNHSTLHEYSINRLENELMNNMYGMDIRGGGLRDWNEELQVARELSVDTFGERVDRAR